MIHVFVMAGLDPAIPIVKARPCPSYRDRRVKPGDDGEWNPPVSGKLDLLPQIGKWD